MNRLRTAPFALGLLALASSHAPAQNAPALGMGGVLCRDYLKAARASDILYHQASQWLLGFATGMNGALATINGAEAPVAISSDEALKSAATYCDANPSSTLAHAAAEWYAALPKSAAAQAQTATPQAKGSSSWMLDLNTAPSRKPLLNRN